MAKFNALGLDLDRQELLACVLALAALVAPAASATRARCYLCLLDAFPSSDTGELSVPSVLG